VAGVPDPRNRSAPLRSRISPLCGRVFAEMSLNRVDLPTPYVLPDPLLCRPESPRSPNRKNRRPSVGKRDCRSEAYGPDSFMLLRLVRWFCDGAAV